MDSTRTAASATAFPFFKLPAELCLRIFEYALYNGDDGICEAARNQGISEPPLLFTCKAAGKEGIAIFYTVNSICLIADSFHPAAQNLLARKAAALRIARINIKKIDVQICAIGTKNFQNPDTAKAART